MLDLLNVTFEHPFLELLLDGNILTHANVQLMTARYAVFLGYQAIARKNLRRILNNTVFGSIFEH